MTRFDDLIKKVIDGSEESPSIAKQMFEDIDKSAFFRSTPFPKENPLSYVTPIIYSPKALEDLVQNQGLDVRELVEESYDQLQLLGCYLNSLALHNKPDELDEPDEPMPIFTPMISPDGQIMISGQQEFEQRLKGRIFDKNNALTEEEYALFQCSLASIIDSYIQVLLLHVRMEDPLVGRKSQPAYGRFVLLTDIEHIISVNLNVDDNGTLWGTNYQVDTKSPFGELSEGDLGRWTRHNRTNVYLGKRVSRRIPPSALAEHVTSLYVERHFPSD